jgi:hypothetical protein
MYELWPRHVYGCAESQLKLPHVRPPALAEGVSCAGGQKLIMRVPVGIDANRALLFQG